MACRIIEHISKEVQGFSSLWDELLETKREDVLQYIQNVISTEHQRENGETETLKQNICIPIDVLEDIFRLTVGTGKEFDTNMAISLRLVCKLFYNIMSKEDKFRQPYISVQNFGSFAYRDRFVRRRSFDIYRDMSIPTTIRLHYVSKHSKHPTVEYHPFDRVTFSGETKKINKAAISITFKYKFNEVCVKPIPVLKSIIDMLPRTIKVLDLSRVENLGVDILKPNQFITDDSKMKILEEIIYPNPYMFFPASKNYTDVLDDLYVSFPNLKRILVRDRHKGNIVSLLAFVCRRGDYSISLIRCLLEGEYMEGKHRINRSFPDEETPLMEALRSPINRETIRLLVENGADVNIKSPIGNCLSPLHIFIKSRRKSYQSDEDFLLSMSYLIQHGADVNDTSKDGKTCLFYAVKTLRAYANRHEILDLLLKHGSDINQPLKIFDDLPGLLFLAIYMHPDMLKMLLEHGICRDPMMVLSSNNIRHILGERSEINPILNELIGITVTPLYILLYIKTKMKVGVLLEEDMQKKIDMLNTPESLEIVRTLDKTSLFSTI